MLFFGINYQNIILQKNYSDLILKDLFQDCVSKTYESLKSRAENSGSVKGWIATIFKNHILNWKIKTVRKSKIETDTFDSGLLYELLINTRPKLMECVNRALDIFEKRILERGKSYQNAIRKKNNYGNSLRT